MPTNPETIFDPAADYDQLNRQQKLAILLITLGPESAAQILKNLDETEVEAVTGEMTRFSIVNRELQAKVLAEFAEVALLATTAVRGGADFAQAVLEKGLGSHKATSILSRISLNGAPVGAMQRIAELDANRIYNLVKQEQPQTIALVTSYLPPEKASRLMALLRTEVRDQVLERLATMSPTPVDVVDKVVAVLNQRLSGKQTRELSQTGGVKAAANLLNAVDRTMSKSMLTSLEERKPELSQAIRQKMFTFDDLVTLESVSLQRLLREVNTADLAMALKTASDQLKSALLGCITKRAAETVKEEMSFMGTVRLRDVEAAQLRIIDTLRHLEAEGEIDLGDPRDAKGGEVVT